MLAVKHQAINIAAYLGSLPDIVSQPSCPWNSDQVPTVDHYLKVPQCGRLVIALKADGGCLTEGTRILE